MLTNFVLTSTLMISSERTSTYQNQELNNVMWLFINRSLNQQIHAYVLHPWWQQGKACSLGSEIYRIRAKCHHAQPSPVFTLMMSCVNDAGLLQINHTHLKVYRLVSLELSIVLIMSDYSSWSISLDIDSLRTSRWPWWNTKVWVFGKLRKQTRLTFL